MNPSLNPGQAGPDRRRIDWIDAAKGLGMILVVITHASPPTWLKEIVSSFNMPLFFVLAGFVYSTRREIHERTLKDARRLLLPYFCTVAAVAVFLLIIRANGGTGYYESVDSLIISALYGYGATHHGITLIGEIWFLLAMFWVKRIMDGVTLLRKPALQAGAAALCVAAGIFLAAKRKWVPTNADIALAAAGFVFAGWQLKKHSELLGKPLFLLAALGTCVLARVFSANLSLSNRNYYNLWYLSYPAAIAMSVLAIKAAQGICHIKGIRSFFKFIGKHSLLFLCVHSLDWRMPFSIYNAGLWKAISAPYWQEDWFWMVDAAYRFGFDLIVTACLLLAFRGVKEAVRKIRSGTAGQANRFSGLKAALPRLTGGLALFALLHFCLYWFLNYTTFRFDFTDAYRTATFSVTVVAGTLRLAAGLWQDYTRAADGNGKLLVLLKGFLALGFTAPFLIVAHKFEYVQFAYFPFAAFCLYGMEPNRVMKVFAAAIGTAFAVTVLCTLSGSIENLVYIAQDRQGGGLRGSYGITYPTNCAAYVFFLLLYAWATRKKQGTGRTLCFFLLALLAGYAIQTYTKSRTSMIACVVFAAVILYERLDAGVLSRHGKTKWITKAADGLCVGFFPLCGLATFIITWMYGSGNEWAIRINEATSDRLNQMWTSFQQYGIHAFGSLTPQSGFGGRLIKTSQLDFLDNSFALLLIRYGWVITIIVAVVWMWMTRKAIKTGHRRVALIMVMILFHSFSEHHLPDLRYDILFAMPLCFFPKNGEPAEAKGIDRKDAAGWIAGGVILAACALLLPRFLSVTRYLFARNGWTGGGYDSIPALLYWLAVLALLTALWVFLRRALACAFERKKPEIRMVAGLAAAICLIAAGAILAAGQSAGAKEAYKEQIAADTPAVELLTRAAAEPVYAGQPEEEAYRQAFDGISGRIFTPEELGRTGRGSILMDHDEEGNQLIFTGAKYTELSPYTGLFTYDSAVIEKLGEAGYRFDSFYSAEREEKLADFAEVNGLDVTEDGGLIVRGKKNFLFAGPYLDQYAGDYVITYTLQVADLKQLKKKEREICELRVAAQYGKDVRAKRVLYAKDFPKDGLLTTELEYHVGDARGVEFKVRGRGKIEVIVKKITWRRKRPE